MDLSCQVRYCCLCILVAILLKLRHICYIDEALHMKDLLNNNEKSIISILSDENNEQLVSAFMNKIIHDIASPLNTITMGLETIEESHDFETVKYVTESASKMIALLSVFRKLVQNTDKTCSVNDIEKTLRPLCKCSIKSDNADIDLYLTQLLLCMIYAIICSTSRISDIFCNIDNQKIFIKVFAKDMFCTFKHGEVTNQNVFQYLSVILSGKLGLRIIIKSEADHFFISCT